MSNDDNRTDLKSISVLSMAFIGDSIYDLLVREYLVSLGDRPVGELNQMKVEIVNCKSQAESIKLLFGELTDEEMSIYKRGRNAKVNSKAKNAAVSDYHSATGLEALFGFLYLKKDEKRLRYLFEMIISAYR